MTTKRAMMNRANFAVSLLLIGLAADRAFAQEERFDDDRAEARKHGWVFNYDEAKRQARKTNRPLMVVFRCVP